jgi:putative sigma-54 modulation protein
MQVNITGKSLEVTDSLREYVEKKIGRLDRYLPNINEVRIELSQENARAAEDRQVAQVTLRTKQAILRAEERSADMFASIDAVMDKMQRQIDHYKGKRWSKRPATAEDGGTAAPEGTEEEAAEEPSPITRIKRFHMVPMDEDEAVQQMVLLGHDFFVFFNVNQNQINVLYRRRGGDFGLIQPDLA